MGRSGRVIGSTIVGVMALLTLLGAMVIWGPAPTRAADEAPAAEGAPTEPPPTYVGAKACQVCHAKILTGWTDTAHGKTLANAELPPEQQDCEACHGAGSAHVGSMGKKPMPLPLKDPAEAEAACAGCHLRDEGSKAPEAWPNLAGRFWRRTLHARRGTSCTACHQVHGGVERSLRQPAAELCLSCHQKVINDKEGGYTHEPVAKKECLRCHVPHGGAARHNLVDKPSASCLECHPAGEALQKPHGQYAVEQADCMSCHNPHSFDRDRSLIRKNEHQTFTPRKCEVCHKPSVGNARPALVKPQKELCLGCHPAAKIMPARNVQDQPLLRHKPVEQGMCTTCHSPHASDHKANLRDRVDNVCFLCHGGVEDATLLPVQHKPMTTGNCLLCHRAHVSPNEKLLSKAPAEQCLPCHTTQGGFTHPVVVADKKPVLDPNTGKTLTCARCHAVHGSKLEKLMPQEVDQLCRACHKL